MRYHWIRDRIQQQQFIVAWRKGADNLADFFTKPLPVHVHQSLMPLLVHTPPASLSGHLSPPAARAIKWSKMQQQQKPSDESDRRLEVHVSHSPVLTTVVDGCGGFAYSASYADTPTTAGEHPCGDRTGGLSDYN